MSWNYYGYRIVNGKAEINEEEAESIRILYRSYIDTASIAEAGRRAGISLTHSSLGRLLEKKIFLGTDYYPQIIDDETFRMVQELRRAAHEKGRRKKPEKKKEVKIRFEIGPVDEKYDNPYRQAEYAYGLIKEKTDE